MIKAYEFLKSQGINCLMLINVIVDMDSKLIKAAVVFFPPKLSNKIWIAYGKDKFLINIPRENQRLSHYGRQIHWTINFVESIITNDNQ